MKREEIAHLLERIKLHCEAQPMDCDILDIFFFPRKYFYIKNYIKINPYRYKKNYDLRKIILDMDL